MDYSKPMDDGQKSPPPYGGHPVIPPRDHQPQHLPTPPARRAHGGLPSQWTTGLFGCFSDIPNCCVTFWCPCITFGQVADIVDRGSTYKSACGASGALYALIAVVTGCSCMYSCFYRSKMRSQYALPESPCNDCMVHLCCEMCALCQEYRDLKNRGFDMSIGWDGNLQRQTTGQTMPPVVQGGMTR